MDSTSINNVWQGLLNYVNTRPDRLAFSRWLKTAVPNCMTEEILEITVEKEFIKEWIEKNYSYDLEKELSMLCKQPMKLQITTNTNIDTVENNDNGDSDIRYHYTASVISSEAKNTSTREECEDNLIDKYVFSNFVVGNSNRFAYASSKAVAENPANAYNPLFLYSDVGLGKTHLMHAIGNQIKHNHPEMKILYISSETFTNEMISSIQKNTMDKFRQKYRNIDVLLIDDIQFLRKKESTQEEFFHTFNSLKDAKKQIIISSDRKPKELDTLEERLRSRFEWGLTADIQPPDLETRMAILESLATKDNFILPRDVSLYIASAIDTNIRELEGAYTKVVACTIFTSGNGEEDNVITLSLVKKALSDMNTSKASKIISIQEIQQLVASTYKIRMDDFLAKKRTRNVAFPRQIAMYLTRELTDYSLPRIGEFFGGRDHTTVIHACEKIAKEIKKDPLLEKTIEEIVIRLKK